MQKLSPAHSVHLRVVATAAHILYNFYILPIGGTLMEVIHTCMIDNATFQNLCSFWQFMQLRGWMRNIWVIYDVFFFWPLVTFKSLLGLLKVPSSNTSRIERQFLKVYCSKGFLIHTFTTRNWLSKLNFLKERVTVTLKLLIFSWVFLSER